MDFLEFHDSQNWNTDKGTEHDYIKMYYNDEFTAKRNDKISMLEIGVYKGGSLNLLRKWFHYGEVYGMDITSYYLTDVSNSTVIFDNAYDSNSLKYFDDCSLDYIIDDGSHNVYDQITCIKLWMSKLKVGGKLIIEDILDIDNTKHLFDELNLPYKIIDLRNNKKCYPNDVLLIFEKY